MATIGHYEDRSPAIGRVFARAFGTIGAHPLSVFGIAFLLAALPQAALTLAGIAFASSGAAGIGFTLTTLLGWLLSLLLSTLTQGALVRITAAHAEGRAASMREALATGLRSALPLIALAILMALGIGLGFALLVVPGVILWVMWTVAAPALVEERRGVFDALGRSRELTHGARWKVFALELVVLVLYWLFAAVFGIGGIIFAGFAGANPIFGLWTVGSTAISKTLTAAVTGTIQTALYIELRDCKDGPASARLADIFA